jgi:hypothetical protein
MTISLSSCCLVPALVVFGGSAAAAQSPSPQPPQSQAAADRTSEAKWEIDVHGGVVINSDGSGGSGILPSSGSIVGNLISLSSFYFGSGAQLFNQAVATAAGGRVVPLIVPLDTVLLGSGVHRSSPGTTIGVRVSRKMTHRLTAEGTLDYHSSELSFTSATLAGLEATRASFAPALLPLLSASGATVTSVTTVIDRQMQSQVFGTGTLLVNLRETGRAIPYLVVGGGVLLSGGSTPSAALVGQYVVGTSSQITGTDKVNLNYSLNSVTPVGVGGGGVKVLVGDHWGVRFDARAYVHKSAVETLVNATPAMALESGGVPYPLINVGALQFSSTAPLTGVPVSSSPGTVYATGTLPPGDTTWSGGLDIHVTAVAGVFWRF